MKKVRITPEIERMSEMLSRAGYRLYIVGEYVRNSLLGLYSTEIHIASEAKTADAALIFEAAGFDYEPVRENREAIVLKAPSGDTYIYTRLADGDIDADACEKDFTVNAMYLDAKTGEIHDPTGYALKDLEEKTLRACGEDIPKAIEKDALMLMRISRLAAELGFIPEEELLKAAKTMISLLRDAPKSEITDELKKILMSDIKHGDADAVERGLFSMLGTGALFELFPPFVDAQCIGYGTHHKYSVMTHSIKTCSATPPDIVLRLAGLLHDIGKPAAMARDGHMKAHGVLGEAIAKDLLKNMELSDGFVKNVSELVGGHMFNIDNSMTDEQLRAGIQRYGIDMTRRISALRRADLKGAGMGDPTDSADSIDRVLQAMLSEGGCFEDAENMSIGEKQECSKK